MESCLVMGAPPTLLKFPLPIFAGSYGMEMDELEYLLEHIADLRKSANSCFVSCY
jgi:hypothetical protein